MNDQNVLSELQQLLGSKGYSDDPVDLAPWLTDWRGRFTGKAAAMLSPANRGELSALVKIASKHRLALVPQGGNSGMVGGATPDAEGAACIVSLRRMNDIGTVDPDSGIVTCGAGVILQNLHDAVAKSGRRFPLTLGGKGSATVGGLVSTNAGGTQVLRHGTMRTLVAGVEAVLADGSVYDGLIPLKKDNRGYDLKHLLIGAEGTLGFVTAATLITVPALIDRVVVWAGVKSPEAAYRLMLDIETKARGMLEGFEILPQDALDGVIKHIAGTRPPLVGTHNWHVLLEIVKDRADQIAPADAAVKWIGEALEKGLVDDATISSSEAQAEAFWKIRDSIAEAERAAGPAVQHDISVPVADMARFVSDETPLIEAEFPGTKVVAFGHLGDGNIHFHVKAPAGSDARTWHEGESKKISSRVYDRVVAYGGSISAEHGIGQLKLDEFARLSDAGRLAAISAIKKALDPYNIMNPGKLVPLAS